MKECIQFENSLISSSFIDMTQNEIKPIFIICQKSLISEQNIDLLKFCQNQLSKEEKNSIKSLKLNFSSDELMELKKCQEKFFIVDKSFLLQLKLNEKIIGNSNIYYFIDSSSKKYLIFPNEGKLLSILQEKTIFNKYNSDIRIYLLSSLILLYANEKELNRLFSLKIEDEYDFKKYYLVNKKWINKFKSLFNYNEAFKILSQLGQYNSYKGYEKNLEDLFLISELKNIVKNKKDIPVELKKEPIFPQQDNNLNEFPGINCPIEFELVPKSLFKILSKMQNINEITPSKLKYRMLIGNSFLYLQSNSDSNNFYIYSYNNQNRSIKQYAIIKFNNEKYFYKTIYEFLKEEDFISYIKKKKYDLNKINLAQDIFDINNEKLGLLILKFKFEDSLLKKENIFFYSIYKKYMQFYESLLSIKDQSLDLSNINNIENYLSKNQLIFLTVYIVEEKNFNYCINNLNFKEFEKIDKFEDEKKKIDLINNLNIVSFINNFNLELISENNIDPKIKYSLVDEEFLKNINLPKEKYKSFEVLLFLNQQNNFLYFKNSKKLLLIDNFNKLSFNILNYDYNNMMENPILDILLKLYNQEKEINIKLKSNSINKAEEFYILNKEIINGYKNFYNYNLISQKINENQYNNSLLSLINVNKLPDNILDEKNILPKNERIPLNNEIIVNFPINFDIVEKNIFDKIINSLNKINLKKNLSISKIIFYNNRMFIKYLDYFFISSKNNQNDYKINYIIIIKDKNLFNSFIEPIFYTFNGDVENYFLQIGLNLSQIKEFQVIIDNNSSIGYFISISPMSFNQTEEPNHCLGLQNIGATCYMNATLQCLCHVTSLKNYFNDESLLKKDILNKKTPLTKEFYEVITSLWKKTNNGLSYFAPNNFKNIISQLNPMFKGIQANDSKDLILFIYETLHKELNNPKENNINFKSLDNPNILEELKLFRKTYYSENNSIISRIFYMENSSNLKCSSCNTNKISFNIISFLIFPLEKVRLFLVKKNPLGFLNVTLEDCFIQNEEPELLSGFNQIFCNICRKQSDALSYNKLYTCPEALTIILNRGKGLEFDVEFKFPMYLNIEKYVIDKNCDTNYELIGVLTHFGPSGMSGHFIAYCKSPVDKKWYCYNDAVVTQCVDAENQINSNGIPYVLYYQRYNSSIFNNNEFILYFTYKEKEGYIEIKENAQFINIIKLINSKYSWIPKAGVQFFISKNNNNIELKLDKDLTENGLKNGDKIIIVCKN